MAVPDFAFATAPEILRELGQRMRQQRVAKSLTQEELALKADVSVGAIKKLESTGLTTMDTFVRAVAALGLVDELSNFLALRPSLSIAEMEERATTAPRKRVRHPKGGT